MSHNFLFLRYHLIWSTRGRVAWIDPTWQDNLYAYMGGILQNKEGRLLCAGGIADHLHLYISLPSTISVAEIANALKANSSRWIHQTYRNLREFAWQEGYGAITVSKSVEEALMQYIRNQAEHHGQRDFRAEVLGLIAKHEMDPEEYEFD
ncbi:MAG: IS200/IS605 family transposase [Candidatus Sumerlaeota bacterium]|nr:IS200/IS605 family transposase [Candidatus Sumerlaeota bacterium]